MARFSHLSNQVPLVGDFPDSEFLLLLDAEESSDRVGCITDGNTDRLLSTLVVDINVLTGEALEVHSSARRNVVLGPGRIMRLDYLIRVVCEGDFVEVAFNHRPEG